GRRTSCARSSTFATGRESRPATRVIRSVSSKTNRGFFMTKRIAFFLVVGSALAAGASAREGFGFTKRAAEFTRTVPPAVNVSGTRVNVTVSSRPRFAEKAELLRQYTEESITASKRLEIASP